MKKLMIAAAIVCAAVATQAATVSWTESSGIYADGEGNFLDANTPVYLVLSAAGTQESLVGILYDSGIAAAESWITGNAVAQGEMADGTTIYTAGASIMNSQTPTEGGEAYFVIFNGDNMYVSESAFLGYDDNAKDYSAAFDEYAASYSDPVTDGYAGNSAWYAAAPEPTSGLLLLLGVAGLALRRRRA